ncbi:hypothetical protein BSY239_851 [Hydrogenophaga sp. RAC07]|uniref:DarT ssDNA thymidine ADP-ribosyltransferase family protein n=1 Tax=Hydrogenophaga sp. RAC07 TaxID=1842537 RepID=UPI0008570507|nr:DarT ssDNA thymidine ADP-ribosyltransferase family protein [Hydrogenophaga sp. RAC07]AOF83933.1 hypothetical protein BSY239_851 [Hydrogenophaga sp. RAC07]
MATTIQQYALERGIKNLLHFTRESNLNSILQRGLVTRDVLAKEGYSSFNDNVRADYTNAVCLSIGFPNYKMWHGIKQDNVGVDWVIVAVSPSALWTLNCAYCTANAALSSVASIPLMQRQSLSAFQEMYADIPGKERVKLGIADSFPTNPQAEVLMLQGVPKNYIFGVIASTAAQEDRLRGQYPNLKIFMKPGYFSYRSDWSYWKKGV